MTRTIAVVVRKGRLGELDEDEQRRSYWREQPAASRIAEVEELRRAWTSVSGNPDAPIERVVTRRRLGAV